MRIERVTHNKFTIFLTFDDLMERGFTRDDLWYDIDSIRNLFTEMLVEASKELGFELVGSLLVHVHLMQAQGMHVTVIQKNEHIDLDEDFIEMKVLFDESREFIFAFTDFENVIQVCSVLASLLITGGHIYYMDEKYYMLLEKSDLQGHRKGDIIAIMSEFSSPSIVTSHRLKEYGKVIVSKDAVKKIMKSFHN
ncbi:MAG TPA: genetic competence negative regulator [Bacillota bacterium]